ncbi:citrate lyase holo-[acyl-carrier protein] synthase [Enterococcus ureasiticus]|uniref:citrate lyase holo-[acyl-carrier protein] synthase n=1 Tax=Enterococcus ureasiticus TaxID=903984 RepID=UPI001A8F2456|nr:citrate lyase holo-[acyl-carrier protein] synthase [Enterococcus ureasiticus]MBO0473469.1 citrate lyase holo-[acyl-carrier protein] synthase [Enterococcus ureasiticus]
MSKAYLKGETVTLPDMLNAREKRVDIQKELLQKHPTCALLSATMNIPGPIKTNEQLRHAFLTVIKEIDSLFPPEKIAARKYQELKTGSEYYLALNETPEALKKQLIQIEETHDYGRLMDLDVIALKDDQLYSMSRTELKHTPRTCFICEEEAKVCGRQRRHSVEEMQDAISQLIEKGRMK